MPSPSTIDIAGNQYPLVRNTDAAFNLIYEPSVERTPLGASRGAVSNASEIPPWKRDDWSAGEGYKSLDSRGDHPSKRGYHISGEIDISVPGQVSLGLDLTESFDSGAISATTGPFLAIAGGSLWLAYETTLQELTTASSDTWTARTAAMGSNPIVGQTVGFTNYLFYAGVRATTDGGVRRIEGGSASTQWVAASNRSPIITDNRLYFMAWGGESSNFRHVALSPVASAPFTAVEDYTFDGIGSSNGGEPLQAIPYGAKVFMITQRQTESARMHKWDGSDGAEFAILEGLEVDMDPFSPLTQRNGFIFIAGWSQAEQALKPRFDYIEINTETPGTLGVVRADQNPTTDVKAFCAEPGRAYEVLFGCSDGSIYRYDMRTGGISLLAKHTDAVHALTFHENQIYAGTRDSSSDISVNRTTASGTGRYVASSTITEPIWDFDLPDTEKILHEVEVHVESMASGTSIEIQFALDGGSTITTDASGNTMSLTAAESVSRKVFTISDANTERIFRYFQPFEVLKTSTTANTPVMYSVTYRPVGLGTVKYIRCRIDLSDQAENASFISERSVTGALAAKELETLLDNTADRIFTVKPYWYGASAPHDRTFESSYDVQVASGNIVLDNQGTGHCDLLLRVL